MVPVGRANRLRLWERWTVGDLGLARCLGRPGAWNGLPWDESLWDGSVLVGRLMEGRCCED